jgi:beta-lactamase regulating signal transducer with metallopeptidase domain
MIDLTVKITALLGAAWIVASLLRGRAASARHAVWIGLMIAALALPVLTALVPRVELAWLPAEAPAVSAAQAQTAPPLTTFRDVVALPAPDAPAATASADSTFAFPALSLRALLIAAWAAVALLLLGRVARAHMRARRVLAACSAPPEALVSAVASVSTELGVSAPPVRIATTGIMPAVIGVLRPSIVLPAEASSWTDERLRVVLLHECAHVRRRDAILQVVANVATAAYWWHPLAWLAARRVARERELACDDIVIASGTPGAQYAEHLLDIARSLRSSRQPALAALAMARPSELEGRLIALLEERPRQTRPARALALGIVLALAAVAIIAPLKIVARDTAAAVRLHADPAPAETAAPASDARPDPLPQTASAPRPRPSTDASVQAVPAPPLDQAMADVLWRATGDGDPDIRLLAITQLSRSTSPKRVPMLLGALEDPSEDIRTHALLSLIHMELPEVLPHLTRAMADESEDVRTVAVMGLGRMDHPEKVALLLKGAADTSEDVRTMAALGLGRVEGAAVDAMLVKLASDESADVRRAAILAIGRRAEGHDLAEGIAQAVVDGITGALEARFPPRKQ